MELRRILVIHNGHAVRGGEDTVVEQEVRLLRGHGHTVELLEVSNEDIPFDSLADKIGAGVGTIWSRAGYRLVKQAIIGFRPDLAHVHNTFNRLSPSVYWALGRAGVPVAVTLHNYLPLCIQAGFVRDGKICFDCLPASPLPGLLHRCYHGSLPASAAIVGMQLVHRQVLRTFPEKVQAFIVPSTRGMQFFRQAGWPENRLFYKPHFTEDPLPPGVKPNPDRGRELLFVGRLSPEKGIRELLAAWSRLQTDWTLTVVGAGPLEAELRQAYAGLGNLAWRGWCTRRQVLDLMAGARALVVPSLWHEPFGMVAVEALACGTPVLAADRGGLSDIVRHGVDGLLFEPSPKAIARTLAETVAQPPEHWRAWSQQARDSYLQNYQPAGNYARLREIYQAAQAA